MMGLSIILLFVATGTWAQDIIFEPDEDTCRLRNGVNGICKDHRLCPEVYKNFPLKDIHHCSYVGHNPVVCCPVKIDRVTGKPGILVPIIDISPPRVDFECGNSTPLEVFTNYLRRDPEVFSAPLARAHFLGQDDGIATSAAGVGGLAARRVVAKYTVLVGAFDALGQEEWFCTGVLLNHLWVLTAAHCIQRPIEIIRVGEHDYANQNDGSTPINVNVLETIIYPDFSHPIGYHDLALLRLQVRVPFDNAINPVCLPWGSAHTRDLTNTKITLTGWGATQFGGIGSSILQEVNVTVFDISVCQRSYSELRNYNFVWPQGLGNDALCAGDPEGGKDACQGDSGGPVTYLNEASQYVLAGVVSRGYGCGLKEFPGLYANIHHAPYLAWIKQVAFQ